MFFAIDFLSIVLLMSVSLFLIYCIFLLCLFYCLFFCLFFCLLLYFWLSDALLSICKSQHVLLILQTHLCKKNLGERRHVLMGLNHFSNINFASIYNFAFLSRWHLTKWRQILCNRSQNSEIPLWGH